MNRKGLAPIIIIILIALVLAAGVFWYLANRSPAPTLSTGNTTSTSGQTPSASSTTNWKTYANRKWAWGYQVEIPKSWYAIEDPDGGPLVKISSAAVSSSDSGNYPNEIDINVLVNDKDQQVAVASSSFRNEVAAGKNPTWKDLTVAGFPASELTTGDFRTIYISKGDDTYEIDTTEMQSSSSQSVFDHMIATFRFAAKTDAEIYKNTEYGFTLSLPPDWHGPGVRKQEFDINIFPTGAAGQGLIDHATEVILRHPAWTAEKPYEDIPIMVFTPAQWKLVGGENPAASVSAAPFPPGLLGQNDTYVFAIPPRYNYDFAARYKDVEVIIRTLQGFNR